MGGIQTGGPFEFYRYTPSIPAAGVFIGLFAITSVLHTYQTLRSRTWIMFPFVLGGYCECIGYIGRVLSSNEAPNFTVGPFLVMNIFTLLAPPLFAASVYMCLGRIVRATEGEKYSLVPSSLLTKIFVAGDITGLVVQGVGSGYMTAGSLQAYYTGSKVVDGGLALLVASFAVFIVVAIYFDIQMRRNPTPEAESNPLNWRGYLMVLYAGCILIFIRSVFRLVEYIQGNSGWLIRHEWTFYVFDAMLMFVAMVLFNIYHPSTIKSAVDASAKSDVQVELGPTC